MYVIIDVITLAVVLDPCDYTSEIIGAQKCITWSLLSTDSVCFRN